MKCILPLFLMSLLFVTCAYAMEITSKKESNGAQNFYTDEYIQSIYQQLSECKMGKDKDVGSLIIPFLFHNNPARKSHILKQVPIELKAKLENEDKVNVMRFCPDNKTLVIGSTQGTICIWDVVNKRCTVKIKGPEFVVALAINPNGKLLASSSVQFEIKIWEIESGNCIATLDHEWISDLAFTADNKKLVSVGDSWVYVWDLNEKKCIEKNKTGSSFVGGIDCGRSISSRDGTKIAFKTMDEFIKIYDRKSGNFLEFNKEDDRIDKIFELSADNKVLILSLVNSGIQIWDVENSCCIANIFPPLNVDNVTTTLSPNGYLLAMAERGNKNIQLFDLSKVIKMQEWLENTTNFDLKLKLLTADEDKVAQFIPKVFAKKEEPKKEEKDDLEDDVVCSIQ